jgi:uncharacterized protein
METDIYHSGELEAQQKAGEESTALRNGRMVSDKIIPGATKFIENQPFFIISSRDVAGNVWTSILTGAPGYVKVADEHTIVLYPQLMYSNLRDIFWNNIQRNPKTGLLFIELSTRRRFRVNGTLERNTDTITLSVEQAYPNCPKYIQTRRITMEQKPSGESVSIEGSALTEELSSLITAADTMFVGSSNNLGEMDASHRGGLPGFVQVMDNSILKIPDYAGNSMYNTFGNFVLQPKAGLLFIDFTQHRTLQLTGRATITWKDEQAAVETGGTMRFWTFSIEKYILLRNMENIHWNFIDYSPFNPA